MYNLLVLFLLCFTDFGCSTGEAASTWQKIVRKATDIAATVGVPMAGKGCVWEELTANDSDTCKTVLECNKSFGLLVGTGVCQVKSWIVGLSLALINLIPVLILASICIIADIP